MFMSKLPPIPKSTQKVVVQALPTVIDTKSRHCMLEVLSGNLYVAGEEDSDVTNACFKVFAGTIFEFTGKIRVVSDSTGSDVRLMYYDNL